MKTLSLFVGSLFIVAAAFAQAFETPAWRRLRLRYGACEWAERNRDGRATIKQTGAHHLRRRFAHVNPPQAGHFLDLRGLFFGAPRSAGAIAG
jgi:hypothetical protein